MYQQKIDGVAMGNSLGSTLTNSFSAIIWLCPLVFNPVLYRRYIDDTFLRFIDISHIDQFLNYINSQHSSIQFTSEINTNSVLNFLDITISKIDDTSKTSVFRKKAFTGLGMKFESFVPHQFKTNFISCLIKRAFNKICSEEIAFNAELSYLQKYFTQNNFPDNFVTKMINKILHNIHNTKPICVAAVKKSVYFHIPYLGKGSFEIKRQLKTISQFYPHIQIRFIFTSKFTVDSVFRFEGKLPSHLLSSVIYEYKCGQSTSSYICQTGKQSIIRISQHRGSSFRSSERTSYEHPM